MNDAKINDVIIRENGKINALETNKKFYCFVSAYMQNNKSDFYGEKLGNGMEITGMGKKCLKIENNFYGWDDVENALIDYVEGKEIDEVLFNFLDYYFEDLTTEESEKQDFYAARKFDISEDFETIKNEILTHKNSYRTGAVTGIGEKCIKTGVDFTASYVGWKDLKNVLNRLNNGETLNNIKHGYKSDTERYQTYLTCGLIENWFSDVYTSEEQYLIDEYGELYGKWVAYFLHLKEQGKLIGVEIYAQIGKDEEKVTEVMRILKEVGVEKVKLNMDNKNQKYLYYTKQGFIVAEHTEISINEDGEGVIKDAPHITFDYSTGHKYINYPSIIIKKEGKTVCDKPVFDRKILFVQATDNLERTENKIYAITQQEVMKYLEKNDVVIKADDDNIIEDATHEIMKETPECETIREALSNIIDDVSESSIKEAYSKHELIKNLLRKIYVEGAVKVTDEILESVYLEKQINKNCIIEIINYGDGYGTKQEQYLLRKYGFENTIFNKIIIVDAEKYEIKYITKHHKKYTLITNSRGGFDTWSAYDVYVRGHIEPETAVKYAKYAYGAYLLGMEQKEIYKYLYSNDGTNRKIIINK